MGDFDFPTLQSESMMLGPPLFLCFGGLSIFVFLLIFVAVIVQSHEDTKRRYCTLPAIPYALY
jgi:hypothetical protein